MALIVRMWGAGLLASRHGGTDRLMAMVGNHSRHFKHPMLGHYQPSDQHEDRSNFVNESHRKQRTLRRHQTKRVENVYSGFRSDAVSGFARPPIPYDRMKLSVAWDLKSKS